ncbi:hypothetical protein OE88DRAFT_1042751 [Heliocybe sulcata]|uniref:Ubiquitin 3 binding protein But2 C-terminal domain-containing protein n=1 Tax=Heliocybe sulcata TaxID=5364 RepID=A0A5C3MMU5_9AGAM|nr:hypothetical protein OE88DRAFT_1042751 [Heliocybe sulcata]
MLWLALILPLAAAAPLSPRQSAGNCYLTGFHTFTLAAINTTLPNANITGAPLTLAESAHGAQDFYLVTVATYPVTTSPNTSLAITNGSITAQSTALTSATPGSFLQFTANAPVDPVPGFCGILVPGNGYPLLAINGRTDLFSICSDGQFDAVVYNATEGSAAYDVGTCYGVTLNMVATAT